jgi:putative SOS response-associated peptidase YedK
VCNLYSSYTTQEAMRRAFEVSRDSAGNVPPLPAIFPDQMAPVVRTVDGERELIQMRWGFPPPPKVGTQPVTTCGTLLRRSGAPGSSRSTAASCR